MKIIITSPSLDTNKNVSGISSVTKFIIKNNESHKYVHFEIGKKDDDKRNLYSILRIAKTYLKWIYLMAFSRDILIHFNIPIEKFALIRDTPLILISRLFKKRMILHIHGGEFSMNKKLPFWIKYILKFNFYGETPKIVLSPFDKDFLEEKLSCTKIFVLPNCADLSDACNFNRTLSKNKIPILLFMGRISFNKGIEFIFHALESLKKQNYNFKFIMAGKGPEEKLYVKRFSDLLGEDFTFEGVVSGIKKTELLKNSNIFLLPSFFEGLPMALIESMSFGLVPITTNVGSIKYLIKNDLNGIIVNKYSSEEITSAIIKISDDKEYAQKLSKNARDYIFTNYDSKKYISRLNEIYKYE
jgi:glycosyltransferase involved in cell wall biosynthesis